MDGNTPRPKIRACSISDPFVLIFREDDSIGLFIGETERGKVRRKDMSPMGDKVGGLLSIGLFFESHPLVKTSRYLSGCFFTDATGLFESNIETSVVPSSATSDKNTTSTLQAVLNAGNRAQWVVLVRPLGVMEVRYQLPLPLMNLRSLTSRKIWTLPKLTLVFSTTLLATLQNVLTDSHDPPALSLPQDPPRKPQEMDIEQILLAPLGESSPQPHLFVSF